MEIKTFKIRLSYYDENDVCHYIDELPDTSKIRSLRCLYNWIDNDDSRERAVTNKLWYGFTASDVEMEVDYKDGFINVTLIASDSFDKHVTVLKDNKLTTRTLFDWIKIDINGQLSDGIGENEVAYYRDDKDGIEHDVWLSDIITDEKLDKDNCYFFIGDPIKEETDLNVIKKLYMPGFEKEYARLCDEFHNEYDEIYKKLHELRAKNNKYILEKLNNY